MGLHDRVTATFSAYSNNDIHDCIRNRLNIFSSYQAYSNGANGKGMTNWEICMNKWHSDWSIFKRPFETQLIYTIEMINYANK